MIIKRFGPLSCAKIASAVYAVLGLFVGACMSIVALLGAAVSSTQRTPETAISPIASAVLGVGAIIICPIFYGVFGFLTTLIGTWLYNLIASKIGGIEIDLA